MESGESDGVGERLIRGSGGGIESRVLAAAVHWRGGGRGGGREAGEACKRGEAQDG